MVSPPPQTEVHLYRSSFQRLSSSSMALLELSEATVRCTLTSTSGYEGWLAKRLDMPDLWERLNSGEHVTVFEFPRDGYSIEWLQRYGGDEFEIGQPGAPKWVVRFDLRSGSDVDLPGHPGAELLMDFVVETGNKAEDTSGSRAARDQWRHALLTSQQQVPQGEQRPDAAPAAPQEQKENHAGRRIAAICLWIVGGFVAALGSNGPGWAATVCVWLFLGCWVVALYLGTSWAWRAFRQRHGDADTTNSPSREGMQAAIPMQQSPPDGGNTIPTTSPPPGWYPDPAGTPGTQRYWDGTRWNPTTQPPDRSQR